MAPEVPRALPRGGANLARGGRTVPRGPLPGEIGSRREEEAGGTSWTWTFMDLHEASRYDHTPSIIDLVMDTPPYGYFISTLAAREVAGSLSRLRVRTPSGRTGLSVAPNAFANVRTYGRAGEGGKRRAGGRGRRGAGGAGRRGAAPKQKLTGLGGASASSRGLLTRRAGSRPPARHSDRYRISPEGDTRAGGSAPWAPPGASWKPPEAPQPITAWDSQGSWLACQALPGFRRMRPPREEGPAGR